MGLPDPSVMTTIPSSVTVIALTSLQGNLLAMEFRTKISRLQMTTIELLRWRINYTKTADQTPACCMKCTVIVRNCPQNFEHFLPQHVTSPLPKRLVQKFLGHHGAVGSVEASLQSRWWLQCHLGQGQGWPPTGLFLRELFLEAGKQEEPTSLIRRHILITWGITWNNNQLGNNIPFSAPKISPPHPYRSTLTLMAICSKPMGNLRVISPR